MNWVQYLFSFKGRINRAKYWAFALVAVVVATSILIILTAYMSFGAPTVAVGPIASRFASVWGVIAIIIVAAITICFFVASTAIYVKRLHDRDKSGWWIIPFVLVPSVLRGVANVSAANPGSASALSLVLLLIAAPLSIWAFVELGCLRGTVGTNRYGTDPLGGVSAYVATVFE